jgi:hypothetical protein
LYLYCKICSVTLVYLFFFAFCTVCTVSGHVFGSRAILRITGPREPIGSRKWRLQNYLKNK